MTPGLKFSVWYFLVVHSRTLFSFANYGVMGTAVEISAFESSWNPPLPRGERVSRPPSLNGKGKREGDKSIKSPNTPL
jgi:hypothetical protein